jgi:hypothetical protein
MDDLYPFADRVIVMKPGAEAPEAQTREENGEAVLYVDAEGRIWERRS